MTKKIEAIIREEKLPAVKRALSEIGIVGLTVLNVRGRGRGQGMQLQWRNGTYNIDLLPRVQINIVLSDDNVDATIEAIRQGAYTGEKGDGMIFIYPVEDIVRISTGERGREAITYQGDIDTRKKVSRYN
ncbi:MAG: P-II family nitrogen regulator [Chloroflexi bacterium]|nr:MAG: transcriptional regulator [Phototrophicales bacterium]RMF76943.1 MAG: P-II family nitrogen regulator [Chloroflexota bacterium]